MAEDRRKNRRFSLELPAVVVDGTQAIACSVQDISDTGARLRLPPNKKAPSEFELLLSRNGNVHRHCRVVWFQQDVVGVSFVPAKTTEAG